MTPRLFCLLSSASCRIELESTITRTSTETNQRHSRVQVVDGMAQAFNGVCRSRSRLCCVRCVPTVEHGWRDPSLDWFGDVKYLYNSRMCTHVSA